MKIRMPALVQRLCFTLVAMIGLPSQALANWGEETWGTMIWGQSAPAVPGLGGGGLALLLSLLLVVSAWRLRRRSLVASVLMMALVVPMTVGAIDVLLPHTFSNGSVASADEVNANFGALESGANTLLFESTSSMMAALPHTFSNGTVADATEVNANFAAIESAIETASTANAIVNIINS